LRLSFYAGEQFLTDDADDSSAAFFDQFGELSGNGTFTRAEVARRAAQGQGPDAGVNQNVHERFLLRSRL